MKRLIVLRPEPGATATARRAGEMGLDVRKLPLFSVEPVAWELPDPAPFDGVLLTSANAVLCGGKGLEALRGLKAFCVGESTAKAARKAGFDIAATGTDGIDGLLDSIEPNRRLLHLAGQDRKPPADHSHRITVMTVYRAAELSPPAPMLRSAEGAVVLIHSPRAARRFAELGGRLNRATIAIAAISPAAAGDAGSGWLDVQAAPTPDDSTLLALAHAMCNTAQ